MANFFYDAKEARNTFATVDPTHLIYAEDDFFAALDAGTLEGEYVRVDVYGAMGVKFVYVVAPFGFDSREDLLSTVGRRIGGTIGQIQWEPGTVARTMEARRVRGETGNPHAKARVQAINGDGNDGWV
jgi:hypothetical protein